MEVTYNGWPLYTFSGDSGAAGVAHGQALTSFGGTWYVLNAAGNPVTAKAASANSNSSSGSGSGGSGSVLSHDLRHEPRERGFRYDQH